MKRNLKCLRCDALMKYAGTEEFQLGKTSFLWGDIPNLLSGAMNLEIYYCPKCRKVEFFSAEKLEDAEEDRIAQKTCPECKQKHDIDYPKCPYCGHDYR